VSPAIVAETNIEESDLPMLAGKNQKLANVARKRPVLATLCCLLLVFSLAGFAFSTPADVQPEIMVLGSDVQTYDLDAIQWEFPLTLTGFGPGAGTTRLVEFSIDGHDLLQLVPEPQRTLPVHRLDNEIGRENFRTWNNYRKRAAILRVRNDEKISFSPAEEREFREGSSRVREIMRQRREITPVSLLVDVTSLPFQVAADGHYRVRAVVERGQVSTAWEGEILIVDVEPLTTNPVWTPADLHIHSTFGGGPRTPADLAGLLAERGYAIGYVTDEPVGWDTNLATILPRMSNGATWIQYRDTVRAASTVQVAMFPGAEISASTREREHVLSLGSPPFFEERHNGHALAYGIQNLMAIPFTFESRGLRYNWFLPNTLLSNINANNPGVSSAAIAHPGSGFHPWKVWSPSITSRYDGYELMRAGQTRFDPNYAPIVRWRSELSARLSGAFAGNGFPSARTGSDWGNPWVSGLHEISFYTFIGIPSRPADMRQLTQTSVDAALHAGRTVASRLGGVASLRLRNAQGGLQEIGSQFTMPVNSSVEGNIILRAARSGSHRVRVIENDFLRTIHDTTHSMTAGNTITIPVRFTFLGGQRFYHVTVEHSSISANDTIYTSPIFIRQ